MWGNHKEAWVLENWWFWTVVLEKTLESPLDSKETRPLSSKGNQPWIFIGRTDAETEAPILWPPDVKSQLIGKDPDAGKDWRQEEKETDGWMGGGISDSVDMSLSKFQEIGSSLLNINSKFQEVQGSLACCSPWGRKGLDTTEWTTTARMTGCSYFLLPHENPES